jgi:hypothetical protein
LLIVIDRKIDCCIQIICQVDGSGNCCLENKGCHRRDVNVRHLIQIFSPYMVEGDLNPFVGERHPIKREHFLIVGMKFPSKVANLRPDRSVNSVGESVVLLLAAHEVGQRRGGTLTVSDGM